MAQKWITKDALGRIAGPFSTEEIIRRIHQGLINEEDFVASYPEGKWISVTQKLEFFDEMLGAISGQKKVSKEKPSQKNDKGVDDNLSRTEPISTNKEDKNLDKTQIIDEKKSSNDDAIVAGRPKEPENPQGTGVRVEKNQKSASSLFRQKEVFDMQKHRRMSFVEKYNKYFSLLLILVSLGGGVLFLWPIKEGERITGDEFRLRPPAFGRTPISKALESQKLKSAYHSVKEGTFADFRQAQNDLIQVLESNPSHEEALALLCFSYYHLWDFTEKNSRDLGAVSIVAKRATSVDRFGFKGKTCRFVDFMIRGKYQEAQKVVDDVLDSEEGASNVTFSYFNGLLKASKKDLVSAEGYLSAAIARSQAMSTKQTNNEFTVMWQSLADIQYRSNKISQAYKSTQRILILNSEFIDALLLKGVIEYRVLRKNRRAKATIQKAFLLTENNKANKKKLSEAYLVLAEISLQEKKRDQALEYAVAAYNYNPGNSVAKNLAIELGGNRKVGRKKVLSQQLVIEGEQSLQEAGCASSLAFFKEAYSLDKSNGYAALQGAKCLWELSFSVDAIKWAEKALLADPKLIEAYVTAANFYIARYDFDTAQKVLIKGRRKAPHSYEIYRGLANLELQKDNFQLAIEYAKRALKIYDADTETLILIAEALLELGDEQKAFQYIVRASENDSRNVKVHTTYGKVLYKIQGIFAALEYLKNRINSFPMEPAYRVALAEVFFEDQKYKEAEKIAKEVLQFDLKSKDAFMILGKIYRKKGESKDALNYFLDAFSVDPSDAEPIFEAGQLYIETKQFSEAIKQFKRILAINPRYPEIYYNMAKIYFAQGKVDEALKAVQEEISNYPDSIPPYILQAEIYFSKAESRRGDLASVNRKKVTEENALRVEREKQEAYTQMISYNELCTESYQKAIDIAEQPAKVYIDLSRCYRFAGELDKAQKMVEKAISLEQGLPEVWRENGLIFEQKGDFALAMEAYKQYLILDPNAEDRDEIVNRMRSLESNIK